MVGGLLTPLNNPCRASSSWHAFSRSWQAMVPTWRMKAITLRSPMGYGTDFDAASRSRKTEFLLTKAKVNLGTCGTLLQSAAT